MLPEAKCGRGAQNPRDRKSKLSYNMSSFFRARGKPARRRTNGKKNRVTNRTTYSIIKDMPAPTHRGGRSRGNRNKYDDTE